MCSSSESAGRTRGTKPLAAMNAYLDELDALATPNPAPQVPIRRILAAYGPKMLELARDRSAGAHTYKVNVAHTRHARETLGPNAFLGVEHAVLFESNPAQPVPLTYFRRSEELMDPIIG
jgi:hypothetical protein